MSSSLQAICCILPCISFWIGWRLCRSGCLLAAWLQLLWTLLLSGAAVEHGRHGSDLVERLGDGPCKLVEAGRDDDDDSHDFEVQRPHALTVPPWPLVFVQQRPN